MVPEPNALVTTSKSSLAMPVAKAAVQLQEVPNEEGFRLALIATRRG